MAQNTGTFSNSLFSQTGSGTNNNIFGGSANMFSNKNNNNNNPFNNSANQTNQVTPKNDTNQQNQGATNIFNKNSN